jgi:membrane fusion protein, heavy metal efflux system
MTPLLFYKISNKIKMKKILYILYFFILTSACKNKEEIKKELEVFVSENTVMLTEAQLKNATIETGIIDQRNIASILKVNGKIDVPPQNLVSVSAPLGGYLVSTKLLPGMHINKGEVIAVMQDQQFIQLQQDYLLAVSKLHFAELDYIRQKSLNESEASSTKVMQQAQAEVSVQQINRNALAEKLKAININPNNIRVNNITKTTNIYASITGFVSKINVNIGKYVTPSEVLFELINPTDIHLNLKIFEKDIAKLSIGKKLLAYNNTNPEVKHPCEIILISKDVTEQGYAEVHCHFEDYDKTLLPGMYMNAEIEISNSLNNTLPEDAVVSFEGKDYVFIVEENKEKAINSSQPNNGSRTFEMIEIETGANENGFITIKDKQKIIGKNIVFKGAYTLLMKMKNVEE